MGRMIKQKGKYKEQVKCIERERGVYNVKENMKEYRKLTIYRL